MQTDVHRTTPSSVDLAKLVGSVASSGGISVRAATPGASVSHLSFTTRYKRMTLLKRDAGPGNYKVTFTSGSEYFVHGRTLYAGVKDGQADPGECMGHAWEVGGTDQRESAPDVGHIGKIAGSPRISIGKRGTPHGKVRATL